MILRLSWKGTNQKYTYQKQRTNWSWKVGVSYSNRIHWFLNYVTRIHSFGVVVNCDNEKKNLIIWSLARKQQQNGSHSWSQ